MRTHRLFATALALGFAAGLVVAAGVKSGPQEGEKGPGAFHPLNINGDNAGKKHCLFCENGDRAVAMIFARTVTLTLTKLIQEIDAATAKSDGKMGNFVVFLGDGDGLEKKLSSLAEQSKLKKCVLSIDNPAGPEKYNVARDADVTVVLYKEHKVKANYAFKKGEMKDKDVSAIVKDLAKIQN